MAISSPGLGSGLDVNSIVTQLMALERRPLSSLDLRETQTQAKISAYGSVKSALSSFQSAVAALATPAKFTAVKASVADTAVASASASSIAQAGSYSVEVSALASAQKLAATGQASLDAAIGTGTLTFDFGRVSGGSFDAVTGKYTGAGFDPSGSPSKTVTIDAAHNSLAGLRDAINAANIGVTAAIVNDGSTSPYRLTLTVKDTGEASSLRITVAGEAGLASLIAHNPAGTQNLSETVSARNAALKVDGLAITKPTNTITDVIPGVTLNLLKTNEGSPTNVSVARDAGGVKSAVESLVKAYNDLHKTLSDVSRVDPATRAASVLTGDSAVRSVQTQLRNIFNAALNTAGGGLTTLSDIGVSFTTTGTLQLEATKLQKVIDDPTKNIATLFAAMGTPTDPLIQFGASTDDTTPGSHAVSITRLASQGTLSGGAAAALTISAGVNDRLDLSVDGKTVNVTLSAQTYTATTLAAELQAKINGSTTLAGSATAVTVSASAGVLSITSSQYGAASRVALIGGSAALELFGAVPLTTAGTDVAGSIGGVTGVGTGQTLSVNSGAAQGMKLAVVGGATGDRGTVEFAKGFAYQLDKLVSRLLENDGVVDARMDGLDRTVKDIAKRREALEIRMTAIEIRYRKQFSALDALVASMTKTSSFLQQQLNNLPKPDGGSE